MTNFVPYVTFMKHAKKVAKGPTTKARPVLSTVYHSDKHVAVTDSHRLYVATSIYEGEEKTLDAQTGMEADYGKYPEVERLIPDKANARYTHEVYVTSAYEALRAIEIAGRVNKATDLMQIAIGHDLIEFKTDDKTAFDVSYKAGLAKDDDAEIIKLQTKYVKEALHVLKDAKATTLSVYYYDKNRPLQIEAGNFTAIILPIRQSSTIPEGRVYNTEKERDN